MTVPGPSRCEQILQHLTGINPGGGILGAAYGVSGRVYRDRAEAFARGELPALLVLSGPDNPDPGHSTCSIKWTLTLHVLILISGGAVSRLADPIRCDIYRIMMADQSLGGLATAVRPIPTQWQPEKGNEGPGLVDMGFQVEYRTKEEDLTS